MKKFLDIFVDTGPPKEKPKKVEAPVGRKPVTITPDDLYKQVQTVHTPVDGPEYQEFRRRFKAILEDENKRNHPGHDYFEFSEMVGAMVEIPQVDVRYRSAFAGWKMVGNQTKQSLISTANMYLGLVDKEIQDFEKAYQVQHESQVGANQKLIEQKREKVAQLSAQIAALNAEILDLVEQNAVNTQHLTAQHDAFMAAGQDQRQEILTEIEKINQYIN